jgi:hypothetical protein
MTDKLDTKQAERMRRDALSVLEVAECPDLIAEAKRVLRKLKREGK